jgi:hypothetical protein
MKIENKPHFSITPPLPYVATVPAPLPAAEIPVKAETRITSVGNSVWNWLKKLFGMSTELEKQESASETLDPIEQDRALEHIGQLQKMEAQRKEIMDEAFDPLTLATEAGLDKAWVKAQLGQIRIRKEALTLNEQEALEVQEAIQNIKIALDKKFAERIKEGNQAQFFSSANIGTTTLFIATTLVVAAVGVATGGAVPVTLAILQGASVALSGATQMAKGISQWRTQALSSELLGKREKRSRLHAELKVLLDAKNQASKSVEAGYKQARQIEEQRAETLRQSL